MLDLLKLLPFHDTHIHTQTIAFMDQNRGRCGRDRMVLDLKQPVQSMPITTDVVRSIHVHGEIYSIQQYVIKFVSGVRQVFSGYSSFLHQ